MRIELIYEKTCPNIQLAREHLKKALKLLGFKAKWQEWEITDPDCPTYAHGLGSPSIMINGKDVSDMITKGDDFSCRLYADEQGKACGAPSVKSLIKAIGNIDPGLQH
jgi:hypothetical protein